MRLCKSRKFYPQKMDFIRTQLFDDLFVHFKKEEICNSMQLLCITIKPPSNRKNTGNYSVS